MDQKKSQTQNLNIEKLNETFMNDSGIIKQILSAFQETVANFASDFKALEQEKNYEQLSRLVHGLKGSAANIRAETVAKHAAQVQKLIDQKKDYVDESVALLSSLTELQVQIEQIQTNA
tara:strand:+ start:190 stop:546 length:357 start_codon:yes stop_codon:yes gene_type:complete